MDKLQVGNFDRQECSQIHVAFYDVDRVKRLDDCGILGTPECSDNNTDGPHLFRYHQQYGYQSRCGDKIMPTKAKRKTTRKKADPAPEPPKAEQSEKPQDSKSILRRALITGLDVINQTEG